MVGLSSRARQGRQQQQNGDTYTLEIAFPAVKYVNENVTNIFIKMENGLLNASWMLEYL